MEYTFVEQSVTFNHQNDDKYANGFKKRVIKNVKKDVTPQELKKIGDAVTTLLDGDALMEIELLERKTFDITEID